MSAARGVADVVVLWCMRTEESAAAPPKSEKAKWPLDAFSSAHVMYVCDGAHVCCIAN